MPSTFGSRIRVTLFGQSHAPAIGAVIDGLPAGLPVDEAGLAAFMARRATGGPLATQRKEADAVEFPAGVVDGRTCGAPVLLMIRSTDARSGDYARLRDLPRPSHADYAAYLKYRGFNDIRGGGQFSGRLTAPLVAAGYLCRQVLAQRGIVIVSHIARIGGIEDTPLNPLRLDESLIPRLSVPFPVLSEEAGARMQAAIREARAAGDSLGGTVECGIYGLAPGLGGPFFGGLEGTLSQTLFAIPAVKAVEFGEGTGFAGMRGSEANDPYTVDEAGRISTLSNHCGGILGGISSGMPILMRATFKPTPSIALAQQTVSLSAKAPASLTVGGRHDPCIVPRAAVVVEAAAAIALCNIEDAE